MNKFSCLVMTGLADVDGFIICIQVCVWLGFPPLILVIHTLKILSLEIILWVTRQNEIFKLVISNTNVHTKESILTEELIIFPPNKL